MGQRGALRPPPPGHTSRVRAKPSIAHPLLCQWQRARPSVPARLHACASTGLFKGAVWSSPYLQAAKAAGEEYDPRGTGAAWTHK